MIRAMMRRPVISGAVVVAVASTILAVLVLGPAGATPPAGFTPTLLAKGSTARALTEQVGGMKFQTGGPVDIYSVDVSFDPGGTSGWHSHPGFVFVTVTVGTLTRYVSDCDKRRYTVGQVIVERPNQVLVVRNETSSSAEAITTQFFPGGTLNTRIDQPQPTRCGVS
jgi:hypothetical protein